MLLLRFPSPDYTGATPWAFVLAFTLEGVFTGFAALGGLLMNFNFMYAGTLSTNPSLIILEVIVLYGWRVAGWYGLDRFLLPVLGTPWAPGRRSRVRAPASNAHGAD